MKNLSPLLQYSFLRPIEELFNLSDGFYVCYCNRPIEPYFFTVFFAGKKGLCMVSYNKVKHCEYTSPFQFKNWLYDFRYDTIDNLKADYINYYCTFGDYKDYKKY